MTVRDGKVQQQSISRTSTGSGLVDQVDCKAESDDRARTMIECYNYSMMGVDQADQLRELRARTMFECYNCSTMGVDQADQLRFYPISQTTCKTDSKVSQ